MTNKDDLFGVEALKDYFSFRDKFMFFEVCSLEEIKFLSSQHFKIIFILKEPIKASYISQNNILLLGCVPAINKFNYDAEPVRINNDNFSYPLLVDSSKRKSILLQKIISVTSLITSTKSISCQPFSSYQKNMKNVIYYRLVRNNSLLEVNHIIISGKELNLDESKILSVIVEACNGYYPRQLISCKELYLEKKSKNLELEATNITRPTEYFPASDKQQYYWQLLSMLSSNYTNLSDRNNLIEILHANDLQQSSKNKINAILKTNIKPEQFFKNGILCQGVKYTISIDDLKFESHHEIYLFGLLLHHFILQNIDINHFLNTQIEFIHQDKGFNWQSCQGNTNW